MELTPPDDLIAARATPPGVGAVAILRIDGRGAGELVARLFAPRHGRDPVRHPRTLVLGAWHAAGDTAEIDTGLTVFFRAPHSYTGNDCAEFHCHGGAEPVRQLLAAALAAGARAAEPGEFTRRAYLNGRLDLAQAEAVADLINAQTAAAARTAQGQLAGGLTRHIAEIREGLVNLGAELEARIDFPEEDLPAADRERLAAAFAAQTGAIAALLATARRGRLLREGARIALVGRPNAGKSSLLNALARVERAIVTPHPGTTRDTIEATLDLQGIPVTLIDTAGLRESADPIERLGIERARAEIERADLVVLVCDLGASAPASASAPDDASAGLGPGRTPDLIVWNKLDLAPERGMPTAAAVKDLEESLYVSARTGAGLGELEQALVARLLGSAGGAGEVAINLRHGELLRGAAAALGRAQAGFAQGLSGEFIMVDLREALTLLGEVTGVELGDAILDRVFSQFCLGK